MTFHHMDTRNCILTSISAHNLKYLSTKKKEKKLSYTQKKKHRGKNNHISSSEHIKKIEKSYLQGKATVLLILNSGRKSKLKNLNYPKEKL